MKLSLQSIGRKLLLFCYWLLISLMCSQTCAAADGTFNFAVFGTKSVTMSGGYTDSYIGSPSAHVKGQYKTGDLGTNSLSSCAIKMSGGATVYGKGLVAPGGNPAAEICLSGGSLVYGNNIWTQAAVKDMTLKSDPGGGTPMGALSMSGGSRTISAGSYRYSSITLSGGAVLTVDGAVTLMVDGNLTLSGGSSIVVNSGPVIVYINGQKLDISGGSVINRSQDPRQMTVYGLSGLETANVSSGATQYLQIFAPTAAITLSGGHETYGSVIGETVTLSGGSSVHLQGDVDPPAVTATPAGGIYRSPQTVTLTTNEPATIYYTSDGSTPTESSAVYSQPIPISADTTLKVFGKDLSGNAGPPRTESYSIDSVPPTVTITAPSAGLLTRTPGVTVSGTLSEPGTVTVNGTAAEVTGTSFTLANYTLTEGVNTIAVQALDLAGNPGSASVSVTLDSRAPAAPVLASLKTPTNVAAVTVTGSAEAGSTVHLFDNGVQVATTTANAGGSFSAGVTLVEGTNSFTATATDTAGNESAVSPPVTATLDTHPPVISVTAPAEDSFFNTAQVLVKGSLDEAVASLTINGQPVTPVGTGFEQSITLTPGLNTITLAAVDLAGNPASKTVKATFDSTPPVVTISAPLSGTVTKNGQVTVTGTVSEPSTSATINGTIVNLTNQAFSFSYALAEGANTLTVEATDRAANKGSASVSVTLDTQLPVLTLSTAPEAAAGSNISLALSASDNNTLTLVEVKANGVPIWSGGNVPSVSESIAYRLSPSLNAGSSVLLQARGIDSAGNEGSASATVAITQGATGPGYLQGKVLDDIRGLKLSGAAVAVTDSGAGINSLVSASDGGYFAETASGSTLVSVTLPGYTQVERLVPVLPEKTATAIDARLTRISAVTHQVDASGGIVRAETGAGSPRPVVELTLPAGAIGALRDVRLTPISNQGLAGLLAPGWSPIAAAEITLLDPTAGTVLGGSFAPAATLKFPVASSLGLPPDAVLTMAAYDPSSHQWQAAGSAPLAADGLSASATITGVGQYALLLPDPAPNAPAAATAGTPLAAASSAILSFDSVTAQGRVVPQAAPPSSGLKAAGEVVLSAKDGATPLLISGQLLNSRITEKFDLKSGDSAESPAYIQDIVLYRYPCITSIGGGALTAFDVAMGSLRTTFPVSPSHDYSIVELLLGKVGLEITVPEAGETGVMVGTDGGRLVDADGNILLIPQGALGQTTPVSTKNSAAVTGTYGNDFTLLKVVEVNLTRQTLASGATLSIVAPANLDPALPLVLARQIDVKGVAKLKLVALAKISGSLINSYTAAAGIALPGITTSGSYYLLQAKSPIGFVRGTVTDSANGAYIGTLVKTDTGSLVDLSSATGGYLLAAPVAAFTATATDLYKGDFITGNGVVGVANQAVTVDLKIVMIPPTVASFLPTGVNVQPNAPVVAKFSKSVDQSTVNASTLKLVDSDGKVVPGVINFNVDGKVVTFSPGELLISEKSYTVTLGAGIKDLQGYALGGDAVYNFTVRKTTPPAMPAAGAISGTFPDASGFITVTGTQGSADPNDTVYLLNDTSGEIVSVSPASNGSFTKAIRGQLGDQIKVVLMDHSGNQTVISYLTYRSDDGRYLVTAKGGKVEGDGGTLLDIPDGALIGPTVVKITPVTEAQLPGDNPVPAGGKFLAAVNLESGGIGFQKAVQFSVPVPADMPQGVMPFLAQPQDLVDAYGNTEKVYVIIDSAKVENGRLTTACPPFDGVKDFGLYVFLYVPIMGPQDVTISGYVYQGMGDLPGYTPAVDQPIPGAVIRAKGMENFVSYSNASGHYATFGFSVAGVCRSFTLSATHPQTMYKLTLGAIITCDAPYVVNGVNFRLANKDTVLPDKVVPVINLAVQLAPGQAPENMPVPGTVRVGTDLQVPISFTDQLMKAATLTVTFRASDNSSLSTISVPLTLDKPSVVTPMNGTQPAIFGYSGLLSFPEAIQGSQSNFFRPNRDGIYTLTVEAVDAAGNRSIKSIKIRCVAPLNFPASIDGPPVVTYVLPGPGDAGVKVDTNATVYFSETVRNVNESTFQLIDTVTNLPVPSTVTPVVDSGLMKATLVPKGGLLYGRTYEIYLSKGITDAAPNLSAQGQLLPLGEEVRARFTTVVPSAYDLTSRQFTGGRGVALYNDYGNNKVYSYITAGDAGWRVVDVSRADQPAVVYPDAGFQFPASFSYRGVAVEQQRGLLGITENITGSSESGQYGYVRFYSLADPARPVVVGRERLAEAYTGIPGRLALQGSFAYISTINDGLQVVNINTAIEHQTAGLASDGTSIVGGFNTVQKGFGQPDDILVYGNKAIMTTSSGYLLNLDISVPELPGLVSSFKPDGASFTRVAVVPDYVYSDVSGPMQSVDLVVAGSRQGQFYTVDVTNPASPHLSRPAIDSLGNTVNTYVLDVAVNKFSGLAYVTTFNSIQVFDLKDPSQPRLLTTITQLPDTSVPVTAGSTAPLVPIGSTQAITELNGWVYLASQPKGLRTLNMGGMFGLGYSCDDCYNFR